MRRDLRRSVGDAAFDVTFTDSGPTVTARVLVDGAGRPVGFSTEDRWAALPGGLVRARWTTPVAGWGEIGGRSVATGGAAVWHLRDGDFRYGEGCVTRSSGAYRRHGRRTGVCH